MPAPLARGIIITVSVLVAATIAAYHENPQIREWIDRTRQKIAMGFHSLGDEIHPRQHLRRQSTDVSMHEDKGAEAEERRQRAIAEIMEKGRIMEEKRRTPKTPNLEKPRGPSFDALVDEHGNLRPSPETNTNAIAANSSSVETTEHLSVLRQRGTVPDGSAFSLHHSVDAPLPLRQLSEPVPAPMVESPVPFESHYEREMRDAWNLPLSDRTIEIPSSHPSESLLEFTPTTEEAPDPDFSIPNADSLSNPFQQSEYFSAATSNSSKHLFDEASQTPNEPFPVESDLLRRLDAEQGRGASRSGAVTPSIDGSVSQINASEAGDSTDDVLSEVGDGIRTPASAWTEVDSTFSGED